MIGALKETQREFLLDNSTLISVGGMTGRQSAFLRNLFEAGNDIPDFYSVPAAGERVVEAAPGVTAERIYTVLDHATGATALGSSFVTPIR